MLHQKHQENPEEFRERYNAMQEAGQSLPMAEMLQTYMDIDVLDPAVWKDVEQSRSEMFETAKGNSPERTRAMQEVVESFTRMISDRRAAPPESPLQQSPQRGR